MKDFKMVISVEQNMSSKVKVAECVSPHYASIMTQAILQEHVNKGEYVKITVELEENNEKR